MFENGKMAPDVPLLDTKGEPHRLWDFRNRGHIAFVVAPDGGRALLTEADAHRKTWEWLGLRWFSAVSPDPSLAPGVYAVDRFGTFITYLPINSDLWEKLEKEIVYHEARHC